MNCQIISHKGGEQLFPAKERKEIEAALASCKIKIEKKAATRIREHILEKLGNDGWSNKFQVAPLETSITITSVKSGVGLCLQTGNMSRMYADLIKLQTLFCDKTIEVGAMILPTKPVAKKLGDNIAHVDRLETELEIYRMVIHMPILLFSFSEGTSS